MRADDRELRVSEGCSFQSNSHKSTGSWLLSPVTPRKWTSRTQVSFFLLYLCKNTLHHKDTSYTATVNFSSQWQTLLIMDRTIIKIESAKYKKYPSLLTIVTVNNPSERIYFKSFKYLNNLDSMFQTPNLTLADLKFTQFVFKPCLQSIPPTCFRNWHSNYLLIVTVNKLHRIYLWYVIYLCPLNFLTSGSQCRRPLASCLAMSLDEGEEKETRNVDKEAIRSRDPGRAPRVHR